MTARNFTLSPNSPLLHRVRPQMPPKPLSRGPVLKDGDTLGVSERERIRVKYAAQGYKPGVPVMQLLVEQLDDAAASGGGA